MSVLYHYTCSDHGAVGINRDGYLKPGIDGLVWLTNLYPAPRLALGLTSYSLNCDRMEHVFTVERTPETVWWMRYRKAHPELIAKEFCEGVMPMHWWVSEHPVPLLRAAGAA